MDDELIRRYRGRMVFGPFTPVDPAELKALEDEIGGPLPSGYRDFIQLANGGTLLYDLRVPPTDDGEIICYDSLFNVGRDRHGEYGRETLLHEYRARDDWWLAEHTSMERLLPIARNGGNDTLFLDLGSGQLVALIHGLPAWTGLTRENVFIAVADSFDAYVDSLFVSDDTAELEWVDATEEWRPVVERWLDEELPDWRTRPWVTSG